MVSDSIFTIELPIVPKDVFRILALRSIAEGAEALVNKLDEKFDEFERGLRQTPRLDWKKDPFKYVHDGIKDKDWTSLEDMTERELCESRKAFFGRMFNEIGEVIDYEVPLDDEKDSAIGKIDLLSVRGDEVFVLEAKKIVSNELPIRAMFEVFTFWKTLQDENGGFSKFANAYARSHRNISGKRVIPGLLLCETSDIYKKLIERVPSNHLLNLYRTLLRDGLRVFAYSVNDWEIEVYDRTAKVIEVLNS